MKRFLSQEFEIKAPKKITLMAEKEALETRKDRLALVEQLARYLKFGSCIVFDLLVLHEMYLL